MFKVPEQYRLQHGPLASSHAAGNNGAFIIPEGVISIRGFHIQASDGMGWEHVSVRAIHRRQSKTPSWDEMCAIKAMFWDEEDAVIQIHPPKSQYVNNHENVLHLWRSTTAQPELPPAILVGIPPTPEPNPHG